MDGRRPILRSSLYYDRKLNYVYYERRSSSTRPLSKQLEYSTEFEDGPPSHRLQKGRMKSLRISMTGLYHSEAYAVTFKGANQRLVDIPWTSFHAAPTRILTEGHSGPRRYFNPVKSEVTERVSYPGSGMSPCILSDSQGSHPIPSALDILKMFSRTPGIWLQEDLVLRKAVRPKL